MREDREYRIIPVLGSLLNFLLLSFGILSISGKLKWAQKWKALIPGLRIYCLGDSVGLKKEGIYCGVMDVIYLSSMLFRLVSTTWGYTTVSALVFLVTFAFQFIYSIRIFMQIVNIFGIKRRWVILWLLAGWLPLVILGKSKKYQPDEDVLDEALSNGGKPIQVAKGKTLSVPEQNVGLSVNIRARTVKNSGKTQYLLKDIALNIPKKSLVLLLGGSGAGKTTMINAIIGYEKADATILLNGADVYKKYKDVKYKIGFVPQQNLIRGKDTVIKTVDDAAVMRLPKSVTKEERKNRVDEVMDLLGLKKGQEGLVAKKSGGQLRRICIAMDLVTNPELFVLDEPDSGLDGVIAREIFNKLRTIADEDRIVLVITHSPDRVIDLFDKVIILGRDSGNVGRLAFYGSPDEAKKFFGKDSMEEIVKCVTGKDEGGEGRADEMIEKYASYVGAEEVGAES